MQLITERCRINGDYLLRDGKNRIPKKYFANVCLRLKKGDFGGFVMSK